jgi:hypothetical protein
MNIEELIDAEKAYFAPMMARAEKATAEQRALWQQETVRERQERISLEVFDSANGQVKYGPFTGLHLNRETWWGKLDLGSQCLGLYEKELLDFIETLPDDRFSHFIDIGAADGYYAIGMLVSKKINNCICFEQSEKGQQTILANWQRNQAPGQLKILGEANEQSLSSLRPEELQRSLVLIDIEGFEFELLSTDFLAKLQSCTIIIEVHNWVDGFLEKYAQLLRNAHHFFAIETVERIDRTTSHLSELRDMTDDNRLLFTSERRPCMMRFLKLTPKVTPR